ncbi:unnamed protein product [Meganyctiphanes norvegica]|uniref:Uncharacterized protein n=1 Tax=Meganyctiphanes norvegica TaxID=48144 RepID=A0AAV2SCU2_MEGNR
MPPKTFAKGVYKKCPSCKRQCPVATRNCPCGHQYFEERRRSTNSTTSLNTVDEDIKEIEVVNVSPALAATMKTQRGALGIKGAANNSNGNSALIDAKGAAADSGTHRRSERVKREKPNFYDALEYENKQRKVKMKDDDDDEPIKERKKRKKKKKNGNKEEEEIDEEIMAGITVEKEQQYSIVLADINFKLGLNNPKFIKIS